jgi:putative transposase
MLVTTVTHDREPIFEDPSYAREAVDHIYRVQQRIPFFLYGFVIMPDHCHFLLRVPAPGSISHVMRVYKMGLTFQTGGGPMWQRRFHIRMAHNPHAALQYLHRNPVKAGFVESPESYPWSSASGRWDVSPIS